MTHEHLAAKGLIAHYLFRKENQIPLTAGKKNFKLILLLKKRKNEQRIKP